MSAANYGHGVVDLAEQQSGRIMTDDQVNIEMLARRVARLEQENLKLSLQLDVNKFAVVVTLAAAVLALFIA